MKISILLLGLCALLGAFETSPFEVVPNVITNHFHHPASFLTEESSSPAKEIALAFVRQVLPGSEFTVTDHYVSKHNGVTHVYGRQLIKGLPVSNGVFNINVDARGRVINMGESFFKSQVAEIPTQPAIEPLEAILSLAKELNVPLIKKIKFLRFNAEKEQGIFSGGDLSLDEIPVDLAFVQVDDGLSLELAWHINIRMEDNWFNAFVSAKTGKIAALIDWAKSSSYRIYPISVNDPNDGERTLVKDPHLASSGSPLGWHDLGNGSSLTTTTAGNNVYAQENFSGERFGWEDNYRPDGTKDLIFDFPLDLTKEPKEYIDAAVTNLFYWSNLLHDIFYEYGFDEVSGNFQENNFDKGGLGGDAVQANAQDGAGFNNANFYTPPDGERPRMRMYVWDHSTPMLDGDLDNGIIIHEYAHGISTRLTGGPANSDCMTGSQPGGMGEGHGDCFSIFFRWRPEYNRDTVFGMGEYAAGEGIRNFPYAYNFSINPQVYSYINDPLYYDVHAKGGYWCTVIYDLYLDMTEKYGFDPDWYHGSGGNNVLLQIMVDAFKWSPCYPTMIDYRDTMLLVDRNYFRSRYYCDIWKAFARRGIGEDAASGPIYVDDGFVVPASCL